ncbi:transposase [Streptomyces sp. MMS24-I2-30]|uniref:transposase n=1 Tax=Streptomyces sp. MMS24-I2-30 TaxID=3351564 RepID=UPI003896C289
MSRPANSCPASPYDPDARWAAKGEDLFWMGYKVHLTTKSALGRRMLTLRPREPHEALVRARAEQKTEPWKAKYALRAGVEGTINQALDITGMRRARYRGLPKVRLQHAFSATAPNVIRLDAYWTGHDRHHTRSSRLEHPAYQLTA